MKSRSRRAIERPEGKEKIEEEQRDQDTCGFEDNGRQQRFCPRDITSQRSKKADKETGSKPDKKVDKKKVVLWSRMPPVERVCTVMVGRDTSRR